MKGSQTKHTIHIVSGKIHAEEKECQINAICATGLTPDQIMELKERDTAKAPIDIEDDYGFFVCPSCGNSIYASDDFESHKFCLNCGQRIQWRE